ncbi:F-box/FBD/LRR-repeat protein At5g53840-like isoform X2 [Quercus lobata]|uniref:F-box domain-containing protein n=1 Tax=Quercus lobata TaxID=97700 RepID=A0A7N2L9E5_QUELO|nr:F-box/FBD/LRR-repeat protein At5g53840-like isoform X2 [Quercus lobata]
MAKRQTNLAKIVHPSSKITNQKRINLSQDRLSDLPDEILVSILSLLKLEERQRTSILSRRWRYLWTFVTCNLVFDKSRLQPVWEKYKCHEISIADFRTALYSERSKFIVWVNGVLELHQGDTIDEFRIFFDMDGTFSAVLDNWISFSRRKKVKKLSLNLLSLGRHKYSLTSQPFQSYSLESLTDLSLTSVEVTGEVLDYILSNCPFIEILHVEISRSLMNLKTSCPLPKLKHLKIIYCQNLKHIQIHAINLVSFKYFGCETTRILLGDIPNFVSLSVMDSYVGYSFKNRCPISHYFSQLETLELMILRFFRFPKLPKLRNLRLLKLDIHRLFMDGIPCCTSFLTASPMLQRIVLKFVGLNDPQMDGEINVWRDTCPHQCLKVVELIGFVGCFADMQLALYLINKATSLEKIIVYTQRLSLGEILHDSSYIKKKLAAATACAKKLETSLAPGVELLIL